MKVTMQQLRELVNQKYDLIKILYKYNEDGYYEIKRPCFCPFHDNTDTPAAAIYDNGDKGMSLYCFSEKKVYRPADALEILFNIDVNMLGKHIFDAMSEAEQEMFLVEHNKSDYASVFSAGIDKNKLVISDMFKLGKQTLHEYLQYFIDNNKINT